MIRAEADQSALACAGASADTLSAPRRERAWRAHLASGCGAPRGHVGARAGAARRPGSRMRSDRLRAGVGAATRRRAMDDGRTRRATRQGESGAGTTQAADGRAELHLVRPLVAIGRPARDGRVGRRAALVVTPMQTVTIAGQVINVGAVLRPGTSGPGEVDLFGQSLATAVSFPGPVRPRLALAQITLNSQLADFVQGGTPSQSAPRCGRRWCRAGSTTSAGRRPALAWQR